MARPQLSVSRHSLCIICEGYEEEAYARYQFYLENRHLFAIFWQKVAFFVPEMLY